MAGYSEIIQTMAAMVVFSLILMNSNRIIQRNNIIQVEGEYEQETVAVAADLIEEARTKDFDEITVGSDLPPVYIPDDFIAPSYLGPDGETSRKDFDDFDDYNGWTGTVQTEHGEFSVKAEVFYIDPTTYDSTATRSTFKELRVTIKSQYLTENESDKLKKYRFQFIRNYYAD